jgi:hypothetical protein
MPQPTLGQVHVNQPLTNVSHAYVNKLNPVADKIFPMIRNDKKSDLFYKFPKDNWHKLQARKRAPGDQSAGTGYKLTTDSYTCDVIALHTDIPDQNRSNADPVLNLDAQGTVLVSRQLIMRREYDFAQAFFQPSIWTGSSTGGDISESSKKWNTSGGIPVTDIKAERLAMQAKTGFYPNTVLFGTAAWQGFQENAQVIDRIKYMGTPGNPAQITLQAAAQLLEVDQCLVADMVYNTANENAATESMTNMFTNTSTLLTYSEGLAPGIMQAAAGYCFAWTQYADYDVVMSRFRMEWLKSDRVEGEIAYVFKQVAADLGVFFTSCV